MPHSPIRFQLLRFPFSSKRVIGWDSPRVTRIPAGTCLTGCYTIKIWIGFTGLCQSATSLQGWHCSSRRDCGGCTHSRPSLNYMEAELTSTLGALLFLVAPRRSGENLLGPTRTHPA